MDTKLKSNKVKLIITAIVLIMTITLSTWIMSSYSSIAKARLQYVYQPYDSKWLSHVIYESSYALYMDALESKAGKSIAPSDALLDKEKLSQIGATAYKEETKSMVDQSVRDWRDKLKYSYMNLDYYYQYDSGAIKDKRTHGILELLTSDNVNDEKLTEAASYYSFYAVLNFDGNGVLTINKIHGTNRDLLNDWRYFFSWDNHSEIQLEPIKSMTLAIGIPQKLAYYDDIYSSVNYVDYSSWNQAALPFLGIISLITIFIALLIPYRFSRNTAGFPVFLKLPFEICGSIIIGAGTLLMLSGQIIIVHTLDGTLSAKLSALLQISSSVAERCAYILNGCYYFILLYIVFAAVTLIKHIFNTGFICYFTTNPIVSRTARGTKRLLVRTWNGFKGIFVKLYHSLINIDLKDKPTNTILKIVVVNFIILSLACTIWYFGILAIIIYSIVLFIVLMKYAEDIRGKYLILLKATGKIADGNLNVTIDEDLGLFNPFKAEIKSIQEGFKNAVEEEIKSQSMKTELISNVSHDLKTPLTSIITYIDLLKDEELDKEKRKEYVDILDRKSQRLKELIEDLFEMSKATSGSIKLDIMDVDVVALMKQTIVELEDKLQEAGLMLKTSFPDGKVILPLDSMRTFRVFENLLVNISKYAMRGSRVYINIENDESMTNIILKNVSAVEINVDPMDITERFVRGDKSRNTDGSGLGLAIAKSFTELQGGNLQVIIDGDLFKVIISFKK